MAEKGVSIAEKCQNFNSFLFGTPIPWINSRGVKIICHRRILWNYGLLVMVVRLLLPRTQVSPKINVLGSEKLMLYYAIFFGNLLMSRLYIILGPIKLVILWNQVKKLYTNDIQCLYRVISSIANLKQPGMDISSYGGWMFPIKDELASILAKSLNAKTSQSKMDRAFMIILLLNLVPDFENIQEQILTGAVIPNFDEALARLLRHTSIATQSI